MARTIDRIGSVTLRRGAGGFALSALSACLLGIGVFPGGPAGVRPAAAQVYHLQAGSSTLYDAHGGSLYIRADRYETWIGLSALDPIRIGARVRTEYRGAGISLGDEIVPFQLPTDVFQSGQSVLARGVGLRYADDGVNVTALGGATSVVTTSPYSFWAKGIEPLGLVFLEAPLGTGMRVTSRSLYSGAMTTILGWDWKARPDLMTAVAAGAGAEEGYLAWSGRFERERLTVRGAYIFSGDEFRRVITPQPGASEMDRENVDVTFRPRPDLSFGAARNNYRQPGAVGGSSDRGTVNQLLGSGQLWNTYLGGALFLSSAPGIQNTGVSLSASRQILPSLRMTGSWLHSNPRHGESSTTLVLSARETLSPRVDLSQTATHTGDNTTVGFGGSFTSNFLSVGVDYQTIYVPFSRDEPFRQALMLTVRVQGIGNFQGNVGSYVGSDGTVRYTAQGSQYLYRGDEAPPQVTFGILENVILGAVTDELGAPVKGAALRIGDDVVFTDSRGKFFVRKKKERAYPIEVLLDEFLVPGRFEILSAPDKAVAVPEDGAGEVLIVVRRRTEERRTPE